MAYHMETETTDVEKINKEMFKIAMEGDWKQVVKIYKGTPRAHKAKITTSGDTALHIAVSDDQETIVEELVRLICKEDKQYKEALKMENERGNTPLHLAALVGNVRMCECIAGVDSKLVGARNIDGETPLFLAALHGRKDAFLSLHSKCSEPNKGYSYCRRKDGDTILHCAIAGDYFDLAYQIIFLYEDLVYCVSEQGKSPHLHLLAEKPFAFRSGIFYTFWDMIIYYCICVDELKLEDKKNPQYSKNYQTCTNFFPLMQKMIQGETTRKDGDGENPSRHRGEQDIGDVEKNPRARNRGQQSTNGPRRCQLFHTCFAFIKLITKGMLVILGIGSTSVRSLHIQKEKHTWSVQILNKLLQSTEKYNYEHHGMNPQKSPQSCEDNETTAYTTIVAEQQPSTPTAQSSESYGESYNKENKGNEKKEGEKKSIDTTKRETAILTAAKNGVLEVVEKILQTFPVAIHDVDSEEKNIVLLAVENRQPHVYELLLKRKILKHMVFRKVDNKGNSALHLAAKLGEHRPWRIPGLPLKMQWEIRWFEFVRDSMPSYFFAQHNNDRKTAEDIFTESHEDLVEKASDVLVNLSNSCTGVAAGIAAITFTTSTNLPAGDSIQESSGTTTVTHKPALFAYNISSLVALSYSVTAMVLFLAIITSRHKEKDFGKSLPRKLLLGFTALFMSLASMLISFYAGNFFVLKDQLNYPIIPIYAVTCLPITLFIVAQFPLYVDFMLATSKKVPQRSFPMVPL